jgi:hypothetical protein
MVLTVRPLPGRVDASSPVGTRFAGLGAPLRSEGDDPLPFLEGVHPYHFGVAAISGNPRQQISLVLATLTPYPFASDCHWLRLLGSIDAPWSQVPRIPDANAAAGELRRPRPGSHSPDPLEKPRKSQGTRQACAGGRPLSGCSFRAAPPRVGRRPVRPLAWSAACAARNDRRRSTGATSARHGA